MPIKYFALLTAGLILFTGCSVSLNKNAQDKIGSDLANVVSGSISEKVQEGVATGVDSAKEELANELNAKEIKISSDSIEPKAINVLLNDEIKLKISSSDNKTHGFYLPGYEITETVKADETQTITFKATKTGTYEYSCNINCENGISGQLIVK